jgi:branched-chain amino acid transport system permease protein
MRKHYLALLVIAAILAVLLFVLGDHYLRMMIFIALFVITLTGHMIFLGYTGQILLCHATFMALGGYTTAILTTKYGVPPVGGVAAAMVLSVVFSYVLGRIILRLRLAYLAIATLALGLITDTILGNWISLTGGPTGIGNVPPFSLGGLVFDRMKSFYILAWAIALVGFVLALHLGGSRIGRAFRTISRDETVAGAVGINAPRYKVHSLMLTAAYASLSGALYVHFLGLAVPSSFNIMVSFEVLMAVILGGLGTLYGVFLAAPLLKFLPSLTASAGDYKLVIYGALFIAIPMYFAGGIAGIFTYLWRKLAKYHVTAFRHVR